MWATWKKSQEWHTRPSELIGLECPYVSWCFDEAVYIWGRFVEGELNDAEAKESKKTNKKVKADPNIVRQRRLDELLGNPKQYRSFKESAGKLPTKEK